MFRPLPSYFCCLLAVSAIAAEKPGSAEYRRDIRPLLEKYCFDCHGDGENKGGVALDEFNPDQPAADSHSLWLRALKNVRGGIMPPPKKAQPTSEERARLDQWIKRSAFEFDPKNPDPGRVTIRRLNRVEYRNTIHDLIGVDFDTEAQFPADDSGYGFDNIGDVLTLPPMLLEKYLNAANSIVSEVVPTTTGVVAEKKITGRQFHKAGEKEPAEEGPLSLSYYQPAAVEQTYKISQAGRYQLALNLVVNEKYVDNVFDYNKCRVIFKCDGKELLRQEFSWEGGKPFHFEYDQDWPAGEHQMAFELQPLTPDQAQTRTLSLQIASVIVRGPMAKEFWVKPKNHDRFFPREVPSLAKDRRDYARELLGDFARRAFRRPVDSNTVNRLADLAESVYTQPGKTFEAGVAQGMVAVLASPRFLFHAEGAGVERKGQSHPLVDEYALASRLSYFLWSSMPDDELFRLAGAGKLRENLDAQFKRMLTDERSQALTKNFAGQWLHTRDIETVPIEARSVLQREQKFDPQAEQQRRRGRELFNKAPEQLTAAEKQELAAFRATFRGRRGPRVDLTPELRKSMRQETEKVFDYIVKQDRSVLELIDSDYTFLNERLAGFYGITNVSGNELRRVALPPESPRGGILTEGTVLVVTSNPTRTSPVKRGVFILESILGIPPAPPPPNIPSLEDSSAAIKDHPPTLRESLAVHRADPLCASCHNRMDPLGLAFENFNAMGLWREREFDQPIDVSGKLITGEDFSTVKDIKRILVGKYAGLFYQTLTEKLLTYALGRGLEYYDVGTVDQIVERLEKNGGRPSALLMGIIESAPFQQTRGAGESEISKQTKPVGQRAEAKQIHEN